MKRLRAVYLDDDSTLAQMSKPFYKSFFEQCGYDAEFYDAAGEGPGRKVIDAHDPHVLICDLGLDKEFEGLHTIRALRGLYPDLFVIGTSRGTHPVRTAATDGSQRDLASYLPRKASTPS